MGQTSKNLSYSCTYRYSSRGLVFKANKLFEFDGFGVKVMKAWPPTAWVKDKEAGWRASTPDFTVISGSLTKRIDYAVAQLAVTPQRHWLYAPGVLPPRPGPRVEPFENGWYTRLSPKGRPGKFPAPDAASGSVGLPYLPGWHSPWPRGSTPGPAQLDLRGTRSELARLRFNELIPRSARDSVKVFAEGFRCAGLNLLARGGPGAADLLPEHPALALMLAHPWLYRPEVSQPWRSVRRLLKHRLREIAAWLGLPGGEGAVRLLRKLRMAEVRPNHLLFLRTTLADPTWARVLAHLPALNQPALALATSPMFQGWVAPSLMQELVCAPWAEVKEVPLHLHDSVNMALRVHGPAWRPAPLRSLRALRRLHDELVGQNEIIEHPSFEFPPPPLAGDDVIQPLLTQTDLQAEGRHMHHCIGTYDERVARGDYFAYHVELSNGGCSLMLKRQGKRWRIHDLKGVANAEPSAVAKVLVKAWLAGPAPEKVA